MKLLTILIEGETYEGLLKMKVPNTRFCITGMPRSRTAWLAALLNTQNTETIHEYPLFFPNLTQLKDWLYSGTPVRPHGYVDGFALIKHPELVLEHFKDQPIVVILRNGDQVKQSWEQWTNTQITSGKYIEAAGQVTNFCIANRDNPNVLIVMYEDLDKYETCNSIVQHCTGHTLPLIVWQLFHHLYITLHKEKIQAFTTQFPVSDNH